MTDFVIAGLGNPGKEHAHDRHNVGFWCVDALCRQAAVRLRKSGQSLLAEGEIEGASVLFVEPQTYVNLSGKALAPLLRRRGIPTEDLIVIYDDLDLPAGRVRLRREGGNGGHNGVRSIIDSTGQSDFGRIRIGIGRPYHRGVPTWDPEIVREYVTSAPSKADQLILDEATERAADAIRSIIKDGWERAMNSYNQI